MDYQEYLSYAQHHRVVPIYRIFEEDLLTPMGIYASLEKCSPSYILESVGDPRDLGRFSFIGLETTPLTGDRDNLTLEAIETALKGYRGPQISELPQGYASIIGYMAYHAVEDIHPIKLLNRPRIPKYRFMFSKTVIVLDHLKHRLIIVCNVLNPGPEDYRGAVDRIHEIYATLKEEPLKPLKAKPAGPPLVFQSRFSRADYLGAVKKARELIVAGDIFQVVLSRKFTARGKIDGFSLYRELRRENPAPYLSYIRFPDYEILSSSPEMLVRMTPDLVETAPIAGTRAVKNDGRDLQREEELLQDEKDLAEHLMLVDLGRNDLGKISEAGTVRVKEFQKVRQFSRVMHLVSRVEGRPLGNLNAIDALRAVFPAGTVTGAPKLRAMEIIDALEPEARDLYAGAVVLMDQSGHLNSSISIRTIQLREDEIIVQAGGGIVHDSNPHHEYTEIENKARAMFKAIEKAYEGEVHYDCDH